MIKTIHRFLRYSITLCLFFCRFKKFRNKEEIKTRHDICSSCQHFNCGGGWIKDYDSCNMCGCNLHYSDMSVFNKLAIPITTCPDKPARWTV